MCLFSPHLHSNCGKSISYSQSSIYQARYRHLQFTGPNTNIFHLVDLVLTSSTYQVCYWQFPFTMPSSGSKTYIGIFCLFGLILASYIYWAWYKFFYLLSLVVVSTHRAYYCHIPFTSPHTNSRTDTGILHLLGLVQTSSIYGAL